MQTASPSQTPSSSVTSTASLSASPTGSVVGRCGWAGLRHCWSRVLDRRSCGMRHYAPTAPQDGPIPATSDEQQRRRDRRGSCSSLTHWFSASSLTPHVCRRRPQVCQARVLLRRLRLSPPRAASRAHPAW
jgi:hypothetical protein